MRVFDLNSLPRGQAYTFRTSAAWKGVTSRLVEVGVEASNCASSFTRGEEYLVFAYADVDSSTKGNPAEVDDLLTRPTFFTSVCSRNLLFQRAGAVLAELGDPKWTNDVDVVSWLSPELLDASQRGDGARVNEIIGAGHDVNARDRATHRTALISASAGGHVPTMQALLRAGASADASARGRTSLSEAVSGRHSAAVDVLLGHGSSVDDEAVVSAAERGDSEMMAQLLRWGGTPNAASRKGWTALTVASHSGQKEVVEMLLDFGADPDLAADPFRTARRLAPLEAALASSHHDIARLLIDRGSRVRDRAFEAALLVPEELWMLLERTRSQQSAAPIDIRAETLNRAVRTGDVRLLERLLIHRPDLHGTDRERDAPLPLAAGAGHFDMVEALLKAGADVNHVHRIGSALCAAAASGDVAMIRFLIDRGADVNVGGDYDSPLAAAARTGSVDPIELLLAAGALIDGSAPIGSTALNEAIAHEHSSLVAYLLERGADPRLQSPVCTALRRGRLDFADLLFASGAPLGDAGCDPIASAARSGHVQTVIGLLERGVRPEPGSKALHEAVKRGHTEIARILISRVGMNVNTSVGVLDAYLLDEAVYSGSPETVRLLIEAGADVNPPGRRTDAPLSRAVRRCGERVLLRRQRRREDLASSDRCVAIVKLLVEAGAALDALDWRGKTAYEVAREAHDAAVLAILGR